MLKYLLANKKLTHILLSLWWIGMFIGTSIPGRALPALGAGDKIKHFGAFFGLSILLSITMKIQDKYTFLKNHTYIATIVILALYGVIDELHQSLIPGRSTDVLDWFADMIGTILGLLVIRFFVFNKIEAQPKNI